MIMLFSIVVVYSCHTSCMQFFLFCLTEETLVEFFVKVKRETSKSVLSFSNHLCGPNPSTIWICVKPPILFVALMDVGKQDFASVVAVPEKWTCPLTFVVQNGQVFKGLLTCTCPGQPA